MADDGQLKLNGLQYKQLQDALLSAFPTEGALTRMVRIQLNENLDAVAGGTALIDVAFELIVWAQSQGRLKDLVEGARKENPGNADLRAFEEQVLRPLLEGSNGSEEGDPVQAVAPSHASPERELSAQIRLDGKAKDAGTVPGSSGTPLKLGTTSVFAAIVVVLVLATLLLRPFFTAPQPSATSTVETSTPELTDEANVPVSTSSPTPTFTPASNPPPVTRPAGPDAVAPSALTQVVSNEPTSTPASTQPVALLPTETFIMPGESLFPFELIPIPTLLPTETPTPTLVIIETRPLFIDPGMLVLLPTETPAPTPTPIHVNGVQLEAPPFHFGIVIDFGGATGDFLLRDPHDEMSGLTWIEVGARLTVLGSGPGDDSYGSGEWYYVEVAQPNGVLLRGWLPVEIVAAQENTSP
jgi:hypothetical protein